MLEGTCIFEPSFFFLCACHHTVCSMRPAQACSASQVIGNECKIYCFHQRERELTMLLPADQSALMCQREMILVVHSGNLDNVPHVMLVGRSLGCSGSHIRNKRHSDATDMQFLLECNASWTTSKECIGLLQSQAPSIVMPVQAVTSRTSGMWTP